MSGNPSPGTPQGTHARFHHRLIPAFTRKQRIRRLARSSLRYAGRMHYTEGPGRSEFFHWPHGKFTGAHADCSQYSATLCHWVGVKDVTDTDYTGTLAKKGVRIEQPERGAFVFFGAPPYVHMGVLVRPLRASSWHVIGFGDQSAPDESTLPGLIAYFVSQGHQGHTFRDLTR